MVLTEVVLTEGRPREVVLTEVVLTEVVLTEGRPSKDSVTEL